MEYTKDWDLDDDYELTDEDMQHLPKDRYDMGITDAVEVGLQALQMIYEGIDDQRPDQP